MLKITIKTENDAFADGNKRAEVARILREVADSLERGSDEVVCRDFNGNKVGKAELTRD
jgi:hypothetical protein